MNVDILVAAGGGIASFLIGLGMSRGKMEELERRVNSLEDRASSSDTHSTEMLEKLHGLRDIYVSYQHFNEIMNTIRETQRELREDMKKVLELLTVRA